MEEQRGRFKVDLSRRFTRNHQAHHASVPAATSSNDLPAPAAQPTNHPAGHATHHRKAQKIGFFAGRQWLLVVIILFGLLLIGMSYMYVHTKNQLNAAKNPTAAGKTEADKIINQIKGTVAVPTGETPTLATVQDINKLKNQTFFKHAQNGDKVLIYTKAGEAILYRPSTKKVIEFAPVSSNNAQ